MAHYSVPTIRNGTVKVTDWQITHALTGRFDIAYAYSEIDSTQVRSDLEREFDRMCAIVGSMQRDNDSLSDSHLSEWQYQKAVAVVKRCGNVCRYVDDHIREKLSRLRSKSSTSVVLGWFNGLVAAKWALPRFMPEYCELSIVGVVNDGMPPMYVGHSPGPCS
jgi:hypothetical protein